MSMLMLVKESLSMMLDRWNGSIAKLMTDPKLLEVRIEKSDGYVIPEFGVVYM